MGMFDSFYTEEDEWQTKALGRSLQWWNLGDKVPGPPIDYQLEVLGGRRGLSEIRWGYVTIRNGRFTGVTGVRDAAVPLLLYGGGWIQEGD